MQPDKETEKLRGPNSTMTATGILKLFKQAVSQLASLRSSQNPTRIKVFSLHTFDHPKDGERNG